MTHDKLELPQQEKLEPAPPPQEREGARGNKLLWEFGQHKKDCKIDDELTCSCGFFDALVETGGPHLNKPTQEATAPASQEREDEK